MRKFILFFILSVSAQIILAQGMIQIKGIVYDADSNQILDSVTVIVKHTSRISQNKIDGSFSVFVNPSDTLIFGLYGYRVKYLCFKDSSANKDYNNIHVGMVHLKEDVREVVVTQIRNQKDVRRDMQSLAYEYAYAQQRTNAVQSPLTAAYNAYSHKSQTKQLLQDYEFQLAKNKLIKQLLDIYNKQGIIDLPTDQYKLFIENIDLDWSFLIATSDYDLAVFVKQRALLWNN